VLLYNINNSTRPVLGDALHKAVNCTKSAVAKVIKNRVILTGDSHIERFSGIIPNLLDDSNNMIGITKPTAAQLQFSGPQMQQADTCVAVIFLAPRIPQTLRILLLKRIRVLPLPYHYAISTSIPQNF
jgi:hypothetical protein